MNKADLLLGFPRRLIFSIGSIPEDKVWYCALSPWILLSSLLLKIASLLRPVVAMCFIS